MDIVTCPHIMCPNGALNGAAHCLENIIMPNPGKDSLSFCLFQDFLTWMLRLKMYNAQATMWDDNHHGSTHLHLDFTNAILNIVMWMAGYALWHIFAAADLPPLCHFFLVEEGMFMGIEDPAHSQSICFVPIFLQCLFKKHGIRPYTIHQCSGQAVFILASCAHQVWCCIGFNFYVYWYPSRLPILLKPLR